MAKGISDLDLLWHAWGSWLEGFHWNHFVTFLFDPARFRRCSAELCFKRVRSWERATARLALRPVRWIAFAEKTHPDHHHVHALVGGTSDITCAVLKATWRKRNGFACVELYEPGRGGTYYASKLIRSGGEEWETSDNFTGMVNL